jgi:hypothetical protein
MKDVENKTMLHNAPKSTGLAKTTNDRRRRIGERKVRTRSRRSFLCGDWFQKPKAALWKKSTAGGELDPAEPSTFNPPFLLSIGSQKLDLRLTSSQ